MKMLGMSELDEDSSSDCLNLLIQSANSLVSFTKKQFVHITYPESGTKTTQPGLHENTIYASDVFKLGSATRN